MEDKNTTLKDKELPIDVGPAVGYNIVIAGSDDPEETPVPVYTTLQGSELSTAKIYVGQAVTVLNTEENWCEVEIGKHKGWMHSEHLAFQPSPALKHKNEAVTWSKYTGHLYGEGRAPELNDVRQGDLNDCFFLAPLAALANNPVGKKLIMAVLCGVKPGIFAVTFCNLNDDNTIKLDKKGDTVAVDCWFPLPNELAKQNEKFLYCPAKPFHSKGIPLWSAIMEKAYARWDDEGYAGMDEQTCSRAIAHLTGLEPLSLHWNQQAKNFGEIKWEHNTFKFEESEDDDGVVLSKARPEDLMKLLRAVNINTCILVAGSPKKWAKNVAALVELYKLTKGHQYVILDLEEDGQVSLWEPNKGPMEKKMPIDHFAALFEDVLMVDCTKSLFLI